MDRFELLYTKLTRRCPDLELRREEPMSRHTSFRIGGPARLMALPKNREEAAAALKEAHVQEIEPFFLGNGSNLLVADEGVSRFVIKAGPGLDRCWVEGNQIVAESGITLSRLATFARENGLSGLEFAHGIPGALGGAACMNAGAYGGELAGVVREVVCLNRDGEEEIVTDFQYGYRRSVFSDGRRMVMQVRMELQPGDPEVIQSRMEELARQRKSKQPLEYPSAGSMFKRPVGYFAGALIEQCGLKGLTVGGAQVSEKHAGFIINLGGATCADVLELIRQVRCRVLAETGVELEMEVKRLDDAL